jgi:hypothetical protein
MTNLQTEDGPLFISIIDFDIHHVVKSEIYNYV